MLRSVDVLMCLRIVTLFPSFLWYLSQSLQLSISLALFVCVCLFVKPVNYHLVTNRLASLQTSFVTLDEALKVTNRRVNALENVTIPKIEGVLSYIARELDELAREGEWSGVVWCGCGCLCPLRFFSTNTECSRACNPSGVLLPNPFRFPRSHCLFFFVVFVTFTLFLPSNPKLSFNVAYVVIVVFVLYDTPL